MANCAPAKTSVGDHQPWLDKIRIGNSLLESIVDIDTNKMSKKDIKERLSCYGMVVKYQSLTLVRS
jgi:hypothetical protein